MATIETGVGILPQGTRITALMAVLAHNAEVRSGKRGRDPSEATMPVVRVAGTREEQAKRAAGRGGQVADSLPRAHSTVPSGRLNVKFYEQWERQLMWATMRALLDHCIVPRGQAVGMARRMASKGMGEYAPMIVEYQRRRET